MYHSVAPTDILFDIIKIKVIYVILTGETLSHCHYLSNVHSTKGPLYSGNIKPFSLVPISKYMP